MTERRNLFTGVAALLLAVAFNIPYALLAVRFDYPAILREPAGAVLARFADGGAGLILTWHAFASVALVFVPFAVALAVREDRLSHWPALTLTAAIAGALAGVVQAVGLWRWVFVVPELARMAATADQSALAEHTFAVLNLYGGVAIGEHLGQLLTALFVGAMAALQLRDGGRLRGGLGWLVAVALFVGTGEGLALALGRDGGVFGLVTVAGFVLFSLWLAVTGIALLRERIA